ncbi:MAG: heparinase II/III-family protein [Chloroflexota bacterium]|nr:heparinase II/III-family protein [Chloroflexota bacterium]PLS81658.1 MAG: hypothetical protein CYG59_05430 [Chloroflexota bacterium]
MPAIISDPFRLTATELQPLLISDAPYFPELEAARANPDALRHEAQTQIVLAQTEPFMSTIEQIPQTPYTQYRLFVRNGDRRGYETPYFEKRTRLAGAALRLFLGDHALKDIVQDYLWNICEESNWVLPAHERRIIDLFSAETGFVLAEALSLLGETLDVEVRHRVRQEIERRIFDPYIRFHELLGWYMGGNNWNGVCNASIAATFLLLEPDSGRVALGLELALRSLQVYLNTAFESDGSSTEGVAYWHYGLINFVALAEMLRARTKGAIDLLDSEHIRNVAAYPAKMLLSGSWFASFSDSDETVDFNPGIIARLAERSGEQSLLDLLARPVEPRGDWRLTMMLRNMLWWDGSQPDAARLDDAVLPVGGIVRLVAQTRAGAPVVLAVKAGHNDENHNQNDVGSFVLHVDGENLLTDPGRGLYSRDYFGPQRYDNIFANSDGHNVPRIAGQLQATGPEYKGELGEVTTADGYKRVELEFARAYPVEGLVSIRRQLSLAVEGEDAGTVWLQDEFRFEQGTAGSAGEVEEALITWLEVKLDGTAALICGQRHTLRLVIEAPQASQFKLEELKEQSEANAKTGVLKRISFVLPVATQVQARVRMELLPAGA